jgi:hypothetical protein
VRAVEMGVSSRRRPSGGKGAGARGARGAEGAEGAPPRRWPRADRGRLRGTPGGVPARPSLPGASALGACRRIPTACGRASSSAPYVGCPGIHHTPLGQFPPLGEGICAVPSWDRACLLHGLTKQRCCHKAG